MQYYLWLFLAGLAGGFSAGLLGVGGGVMYLLILPIALTFLGVPSAELAQYTIANSIFGALFASLSGNIAEIRNKNFFWREVALVATGAVTVSLFMLFALVNTKQYSTEAFTIVVILMLLGILIKTLADAKKEHNTFTPPRHYRPKLTLAGAAGGLLASLTGLGGGAIMVPLLNIGLRMSIKRAKSISLGVIFFTALCMTVYNLLDVPRLPFEHAGRVGYIVFPAALPLAMGVVLSAPSGVRVGRKVPARYISYTFAFFILVVIAKKAQELYALSQVP